MNWRGWVVDARTRQFQSDPCLLKAAVIVPGLFSSLTAKMHTGEHAAVRVSTFSRQLSSCWISSHNTHAFANSHSGMIISHKLELKHKLELTHWVTKVSVPINIIIINAGYFPKFNIFQPVSLP